MTGRSPDHRDPSGRRTQNGDLPAPSIAAFADSLDQVLGVVQRVLLTGPVDPDGDSIGACLALARGIAFRHPGLTVHVAGRAGIRYGWLADADAMIPDSDVTPDYDLVMILDGDRHRLEPPVDRAYSAADYRGIIDHHGSTTLDGYDLHLVDRKAASTCQLVYALVQMWGLPLNQQLAEMLYTGLIFDTGGFRHSNTTPHILRLAARLLETGINPSLITLRVLNERSASGTRLLGQVLERSELRADGAVAIGAVPLAAFRALGAQTEDLEGVVDALLHTRGVEVACLFIEKKPGKVKLSLRSRKRVDVSALAASLHPSGGGHARAAGVVLPEALGAAWARVPPVLCRAVQDDGIEVRASAR